MAGQWLRRRPEAAAPPRRPLPTPGALRRERRSLLKLREERLRDLGGLMLEMFRQDRFREELIRARCDELLGIDARLHELEALLALATRGRPPLRCACGAPVLHGSHFCPNCGRPAGEQPIVACAVCLQPLAADARFCPGCGSAPGTQPLDAVPVQELPQPEDVRVLKDEPAEGLPSAKAVEAAEGLPSASAVERAEGSALPVGRQQGV